MRIMYALILFLLTLPFVPNAFGQQPDIKPCGTKSLGEQNESFRKSYFQNYPTNRQNLRMDRRVLYVPVAITVLKNSNGKLAKNPDKVFEAFCKLNNYFEDAGIRFYLKGLFVRESDALYWIDGNSNIGNLLRIYQVSGALNIFCVKEVSGYCGIYEHNSDNIIIDETCISGATMPHEIGHQLGLPHTFNGWENGNNPPIEKRELVDGSNCRKAGDRFCDTPADYLDKIWACPYGGNITDPEGRKIDPDGSLIMSYSWCRNRFSKEQADFMRAKLETQRAAILSDTIPEFLVERKPELLYPRDSAVLDSDQATLRWRKIEKAVGYRLHLDVQSFSDMYRLNSYRDHTDIWSSKEYNVGRDYYPSDGSVVTDTFFTINNLIPGMSSWWVEPFYNSEYAKCSRGEYESSAFVYYEGSKDFSESEEKLRLFPNPMTRHSPINIAASQELEMADLQLVNINGKVVYKDKIISGIDRLALPRLKSGIYVVKISTPEEVYTKRLVISYQ